ncbi:MAG: hypothetical protein GX962_11800 [Epulopiscium sp.]|nr:hypothetical protein [Candidatus Epulonipiscium sp.]
MSKKEKEDRFLFPFRKQKIREKDNLQRDEEKISLGIGDIVAIFIAAAQILLPYLLVFIVGWGLFIWFATNFWLK